MAAQQRQIGKKKLILRNTNYVFVFNFYEVEWM